MSAMWTAVKKGSGVRASRALSLTLARVLRGGVVALVVAAATTAQLSTARVALGADPAPETLEEAAARDQARVHAVQERMAPALETSRRIAREVERRYRIEGADLVVPDVALTVVVETIELAPGVSRPARSVPAENGIWFAICRRPPCAVRRQAASRELALVARRQALELALRTLRETTVDVVVIALPTRWVAVPLLILTRDVVLAEDDSGRALRRLSFRGRVRDAAADEVVRHHLFVHGGLIPYSRTRDSLLAFPLEPRREGS